MKARIIVLALVAMLAVLALTLTGSASAATTTTAPTETSLSDSTLFGTQTQTFADGSSMVSDVSPDSSTALAIGSDGYPCADVGYRAIVKWVTLWGTLTSWTWDMHFGVHVCHDKVQYVNHLYASVDSEIPTWSYCGVVYKDYGPTLPYTSAWGHMEGCFDLYDKIVVEKLPWAKITIGGNGGLWARSTGVN